MLNISDIAKVLGLESLDVTNAEANPVPVTDQDGNPLVSWTDSVGVAHTDLAANGDYYYSERGFVGMIVQVDGKYVVVFRGTDTTLSGWSKVRATAIVIARPLRGRGDPGNRRRVPDNAGLPRRLRLLAMTGRGGWPEPAIA